MHEVLLEKSKSYQISWKIMSSDAEYTKALFVTKHVNRRVIGKSLSKTIPSPVTSEMDEGSDSEEEYEDDNEDDNGDESSEGEEAEEDERESEVAKGICSKAAVATNLNPLPDIANQPLLSYEEVKVNSQWVSVKYFLSW